MNRSLIILLAFLTSCHVSKNIQTEKVNVDSIVNTVSKKWQKSIDSLNVEYNRHLSELTNIGATFTPCPPAVVPDSVVKMLDSAAQWRIMLWQRDNKIQALNTKLKVNADGSFETTQQVTSLQIAKSRTEDENIALRHSNTVLAAQLDSAQTELKKEQESKSKVVEKKVIPIWVYVVMVVLAIGGYGVSWWRHHGNA